jgi:hypothetical protein
LSQGLGVGLFSQAGIVLLSDFFAERRAHEYMAHPQGLIGCGPSVFSQRTHRLLFIVRLVTHTQGFAIITTGGIGVSQVRKSPGSFHIQMRSLRGITGNRLAKLSQRQSGVSILSLHLAQEVSIVTIIQIAPCQIVDRFRIVSVEKMEHAAEGE